MFNMQIVNKYKRSVIRNIISIIPVLWFSILYSSCSSDLLSLDLDYQYEEYLSASKRVKTAHLKAREGLSSIHNGRKTTLGDTTIASRLQKGTLYTIMQWNIGHFSMGNSPYSRITDDSFDSQLSLFRKMIAVSCADLISISEFSVYFSNTTNHPFCRTDSLLFSSYDGYIGNNEHQRNYSLNAFFSKIGGTSSANTIEYAANKTATITHSNAIKATDYYYISSTTRLEDKDVWIVITHLAFDVNNPDIARNQILELIGTFDDFPYVIICGDFNTQIDKYELFINAGYKLANHGELGNFGTYPSSNPNKPLDNIIVKGFDIYSVRVEKSFLSDHLPIICEISFKDE